MSMVCRAIAIVLLLIILPVDAMPDDLSPSDMAARIAKLERLVGELRLDRNDSWLNTRRAEEVKMLVREVLGDADMRESLLNDGLASGHDGQRFWVGSVDGSFLLHLGGQMQARYIFNRVDRPLAIDEEEFVQFGPGNTAVIPANTSGDRNTGGFQMRRMKLRLGGHVIDPKFTYGLQFNGNFAATDRIFLDDSPNLSTTNPPASLQFAGSLPNIGVATGTNGSDTFVEDAWIAHTFKEDWRVKVGQFKGPFLREESVDSSHQLAVERSLIADYMTVDRTQGVELHWQNETKPWRFAAMLHDGSYAAGSDFDRDMTEFAITGRAEWLASGSWAQFDDFAAWSSDGKGLLFGAAVDWEMGERGRVPVITHFTDDIEESYVRGAYDVLKWTFDVSYENPDLMGLSMYVAIIGQHLENHSDRLLPMGDAQQYGAVAQAGIFLLPDRLNVYARYEWLDLDGLVYAIVPGDGHYTYPIGDPFDDALHLVTVGGNYFFAGHAAKLSGDVVWSVNGLPFNATGAGLRSDAGGGQLSFRSQFQLMF